MLSGVRTVITEAGIQGTMANNYAAEQRHAALATEWPTTCWRSRGAAYGRPRLFTTPLRKDGRVIGGCWGLNFLPSNSNCLLKRFLRELRKFVRNGTFTGHAHLMRRRTPAGTGPLAE
jgi:hypothetical protein